MRIIPFLLIIISLFSCQSDQKEMSDKQKEILERETEYVTEYYSNGKKKIEGELINGERHGPWKYYYENGFLWSEGNYWYGKRKGYSTVYYESGKAKLEGAYKNNLKVGIWKIWKPVGTLAKKINMNEILSKEDSLKLELL